MSSKFTKLLQRYRVLSGFAFAVVYLIFSRPIPLLLGVGVGIALLGVIIRAWACGHLRKGKELDISGPYAHTRNPLYLGTLIIVIGFGVASGVWWLLLLAAVLIISIYFPVMHVEAVELEKRLGNEYKEYSDNVPLLIPRISPWKNSDRRFDFRLYLKNGEYNAAIGLVFAAAFLLFKSYFFLDL